MVAISSIQPNHFSPSVAIIGAGVAGLSCACELIDRGIKPIVYEQSRTIGEKACSWLAGGMLAPWCEAESADPAVLEMGISAKQWWLTYCDEVEQNGSLVLSPQRDLQEIDQFTRRTSNYHILNKDQIQKLEPDLADRFERGLWFQDEAHLNPRTALQQLAQYITKKGAELKLGDTVEKSDLDADYVIDCRGLSAQNQLKDLRGVRGEMLILQTDELNLSRPIRLLHPRHPIYIVPRGNGKFMLGATMIENQQRGRVSALSVLELLSAAYALHPSFGEAEIIEMGADVRPAFNDNLPSLKRKDNVLYINGLYRHGFLLSPHMAKMTADAISNEQLFMSLEQCV